MSRTSSSRCKRGWKKASLGKSCNNAMALTPSFSPKRCNNVWRSALLRRGRRRPAFRPSGPQRAPAHLQPLGHGLEHVLVDPLPGAPTQVAKAWPPTLDAVSGNLTGDTPDLRGTNSRRSRS